MMLGKLLEEMSLSLGVEEFAVVSKNGIPALEKALVALEWGRNAFGGLGNTGEFRLVALE